MAPPSIPRDKAMVRTPSRAPTIVEISGPSTSTSHPNFASIFNAAVEAYSRKTKIDLASLPVLPILQSCNSTEAILAVLREYIPASSQSQKGDDRLTKCVIPTVNVLYSFSTALGGVVGPAFSPGNIIFAGISVLFLAAKDATSGDKLIDLFTRIGNFFRPLEVYTGITPPLAMTQKALDIMVEVLSILAIATKEAKLGRLNTYFKKLIGSTDIENGLRRLDELTQEVILASADRPKITYDTDDRVMSVNDRVHIIDDQVDRVNRNQLRDQLLRWLSPSDPSINHNLACKARHNGTAQWFLQGSIYNRWKSTGSLLWIHGKPGSGKTILCSSITQDIMALRDAGMASIAYFYFDYRNVDKQRLLNLLPSLLIQLSTRSNPSFDVLFRLYSAHDRGTQKPNDRAMVECLKEMLFLNTQVPTFIIMDALDECPKTSTIPSPREEALELVNELVGLQLPNLHLCVTSRPEPDIQAILGPLTPHPVSLHDERGHQQDIANYVSSIVYSDRMMRKWWEEDKNLVIKILREKGDGMFSWVFSQLEVLRYAQPSSIRQVLEELPESLDETYERILREIRKPNQGHVHQLLHCLTAAVRPLRVEEIAEVLAIDFNTEGIPKLNPNRRWEDREETVMSACSSLVIIVKDGDSRIVRFSHSSIKQFLTSNRLAEPVRHVSSYHIQLERAHSILAQACLGVLLRSDDRVGRDNIEGFPLSRYAAQYWAMHARVADASSGLKDRVECLFDVDKPHFATWLWMYNEDRGGRSMSTIRPKEPEASPLYYAARLGFQDLVKHLIAKRPEQVNARGGREMTPMHAAASGGHANILRLLHEHGADVNSRNKYGETPLQGASWNGKLDAGQCLLDLGADINAQNEDDWTPLFHAVFHGHTEFALMLIRRGAMINARSVFGSTPLHAAVRGGEVQAVRLLLVHGADVNARNSRGWTPSRCKSTLRQEMIETLAEYGAEFGNLASLSSPDDGSSILMETPFSGADTATTADTFRKALRKPDFVDRTIEGDSPKAQEQKEHQLLSSASLSSPDNGPSIFSAADVAVMPNVFRKELRKPNLVYRTIEGDSQEAQEQKEHLLPSTASLSSSDDGSPILTETPFSGADAAIMADAFRKALRKP